MARRHELPGNQTEIWLRIILVKAPSGVDFGIQEGQGSAYATIQTQRSKGEEIAFNITVTVKYNREDGLPNFLGPRVHGPVTARFIYVNIGKSAGQIASAWDRRMKIPLHEISWDMIRQTTAKTLLEARLPGTGKDGGPSCATTAPLGGWTPRKK